MGLKFSSSTSKSVALLDVDHTLLFDVDTVNTTLLDALKKKKIQDIYLFTDMTFQNHSIEERNKLIRNLEDMHHFKVYGVITPCDLTWEDIDNIEVIRLNSICFDNKTYKGKFYGKEFKEFMESKQKEMPHLYRALLYNPENKVIGKAYKDANDELIATNGSLSEATSIKSIFSKAFGDYLAHEKGYKHVKGLMLDLFLRKITNFDNVIIFDDNKSVEETIINFQPAIQTISHMPSITMILVTGADMEISKYMNLLEPI